MILTPFRVIAWLLGIVVVGVPAAALAFFLLAVIGSPGTCESAERPITADLALAASFQEKWDQLNATLDAAQVSSAVFSESEATSRGRVWVEEHDAPVSDLLICFTVEGGSASGNVDVPFLPGDVNVLVRGTLDLTGERPKADIDEIEVGGLPGPLSDLVRGFVTGLIDDQTEEIELRHDYGLSFADGEMTISGQP